MKVRPSREVAGKDPATPSRVVAIYPRVGFR
jgi:hypothetical protein